MLRNTLLTLLILVMGKCYAQENYFVLIQADNNQPFYIRLEDKTLSSTSKGHLILSQLKGGNHSITIGWPRQLFPEQQYSFDINGKDLEFQLKDQGEKGWGLFNPQTQELLAPDKKDATSTPHIEGVKKDDAFSRLMAGVVSDTAVMYNTYAMEATLKDSPAVKPVVKVDSSQTSVVEATPRPADTVTLKVDSAVVAVSSTLPAGKTDSLASEAAPSQKTDSTVTEAMPRPISTVVKLSERKTSRGLRLAFADRAKGRKADTVIVIIPMDSSLTATKTGGTSGKAGANGIDSAGGRQVAAAVVHKSSDSSQSGGVPASTEQEYRSDTLHLYAGPKKGVHNAATGELFRKPDSSQKKEAAKPLLVNSDCRNFASDYDVDKLRVKMLEVSKDDDKIATAKKIFKTRCFTTKQIRALSEVFTGDGAKYRFFEAAYPFVSDDRFRDLTDLLADPVYNGKFRAMTGQR